MIDAELLLRSLRGEPLRTVTHGQTNTIIRLDDGNAVVATSRSPGGVEVSVARMQDALDRLGNGETIELAPRSVGFRSSFLGAVLATVPFVHIDDGRPRRARRDPGANTSPVILREFERRLAMWSGYLDAGAGEVAPEVTRSLDLYGGAQGIWVDVRRTRSDQAPRGVTVSVKHTGRHYPDDVSNTAVLYHYPQTGRIGGRDDAEVAATRATKELRLPVFLVEDFGARRTVRRGWVVSWDDDERVFLIEFGHVRPVVPAGDDVDHRPFSLFEDERRTVRETHARPNQQRFKFQVLQRYGARCVFCDLAVSELLDAAHIVPHASRGSNDPRNGLSICINHHRAWDSGLIAIDPDTTAILAVGDYSLVELGVTRSDLRHLPRQPEPEALHHRSNA